MSIVHVVGWLFFTAEKVRFVLFTASTFWFTSDLRGIWFGHASSQCLSCQLCSFVPLKPTCGELAALAQPLATPYSSLALMAGKASDLEW